MIPNIMIISFNIALNKFMILKFTDLINTTVNNNYTYYVHPLSELFILVKQEESYKKDNFALDEALYDWMIKIHVKNCTI